MIEILYNAIHLTANDEKVIYAAITDYDDKPVTSGDCYIVIPSAGIRAKGINETGVWRFVIPSSDSRGRHEYFIELDGAQLDFSNAVYFE